MGVAFTSYSRSFPMTEGEARALASRSELFGYVPDVVPRGDAWHLSLTSPNDHSRALREVALMRARAGASIFARMVAAGIEAARHESDLYVRDCPEARALCAEFPDVKWRPFIADDGSGRWIDLPFQYQPYWEERAILASQRKES